MKNFQIKNTYTTEEKQETTIIASFTADTYTDAAVVFDSFAAAFSLVKVTGKGTQLLQMDEDGVESEKGYKSYPVRRYMPQSKHYFEGQFMRTKVF